MIPLSICALTVSGLTTTPQDRKSTRLNSSHDQISYAVFCLKKKKKIKTITDTRTDSQMTRTRTAELYTIDRRATRLTLTPSSTDYIRTYLQHLSHLH